MGGRWLLNKSKRKKEEKKTWRKNICLCAKRTKNVWSEKIKVLKRG